MTAFSLAPYPSLAGRPRSQLYFGLHPQGFAVSSASRATSALRHHRFDAVRSRFCARARALALHPLGNVCVSSGGGTFHTGLNRPAAAALPLSLMLCAPGRFITPSLGQIFIPGHANTWIEWPEIREIITTGWQRRRATEPAPPTSCCRSMRSFISSSEMTAS